MLLVLMLLIIIFFVELLGVRFFRKYLEVVFIVSYRRGKGGFGEVNEG